MPTFKTPSMIREPGGSGDFDRSQWWFHTWNRDGQKIQVLHREPFRWRWLGTQMVTFVFLVDRAPESLETVVSDFESMHQFASQQKKTWLPFGFQCGFALLPIYIGEAFPDALVEEIRGCNRSSYCVLRIASLLDLQSGTVHTLEQRFLWGCVYRSYLLATIQHVTTALHRGSLETAPFPD